MQIWAHHKSAGHSVEKVNPFLLLLVKADHDLYAGEDRTRHPRREGVLHERLGISVLAIRLALGCIGHLCTSLLSYDNQLSFLANVLRPIGQ